MNQTEKQVIPQLRFLDFEGEWKKSEIGDTFKLFNGYAFSSSDSLNSDGALWVKIADVGIDKMKTDNLSYLPYEYVEEYKKFVLSEGDYVVALTRPILRGNLKIARIDEYFNNSLLNQRVAKLITDNNSSFIYNLLKRNRLIKSIENNIAGSDPPNLSPNDINHIKINISSIPEQKKIASFLTDVDTKITKLTKKKDLLEQYKKGIMQKIFNQELRFKDDEGNKFTDWEEKKLGEIFKFKQGFQFSVNEQSERKFKGSVEFIRIINVTSDADDKRFVPDPGKEHHISYEDLFMVRYGDAGRIANGFSGIIANNMFRLLPKINVHKMFFFYVLGRFYNKIHSLSGSSTMPAISFSTIDKLKIKIPSIEEQIKIADFLSDIDLKIEALNNKIENSKNFKKGLLQKMFV